MYKVLCDGALMCDSRIEELALINPVVNLEENKAGSFSFTITPAHPKHDAIQRRKSIVEVYDIKGKEEELLFYGVCIEAEEDFYKQKRIYCEGLLTYFNDSIQRPMKYQGTIRGYLEVLVSNHNAQVEEEKQFQVGMVTVHDSNDYMYCYTNMESTMKCLKEDLVDDLGGIIRIRHENGVKYVDYLAESPNTNSQAIKLGKNLVDFSSNIDTTDIATAIIPLGAKVETSAVEGLETRLTIESVNDGKDYVYSESAVGNFGWIYKVVTFDDVTDANNLKGKAEEYLNAVQFENVVIEAKAVDMHLTDKSIERFKVSDEILVISEPHGLNKRFRLTKQTLNLNNPEKDTVTLGKNEVLSLSAKTVSVQGELEQKSESILSEAIKNATSIIANAMGGYVVKTNDEILIMDTNDIKTAKKVWRWNINGLGYSKNGYAGPYELAMTMDGAIVADMITAGILNANLIRAGVIQSLDKSSYWDLENNEIHINGTLCQSSEDGHPAVVIADNQIDMYDWRDDHSLVGGLATSVDSSTRRKGLTLWCDSDDKISIGYLSDYNTTTPVFTMDAQTAPTQPPWIRNTATGTLFPNHGGVKVQNGLITDWNITGATGTLQATYGQSTVNISVKDGLITGWSYT